MATDKTHLLQVNQMARTGTKGQGPTEEKQEMASSTNSNVDFRGAQRTSTFRVNVFLFESVGILGLYLWAIQRRFEVILSAQAVSLAVMGIVYMGRLNIMSRWLLKRELSMEELTFVMLIWLPSILASYVFLAREDKTSTLLVLLSFSIYLLGSFLNTYSEYERMVWKKDEANRGHCYTIGLFAFSRNINYFGDSLLFTGWAMATGNWINAWAPIMMSLMFFFMHIPDKETYLAQRYQKEWDCYKSTVKASFIPGVC